MPSKLLTAYTTGQLLNLQRGWRRPFQEVVEILSSVITFAPVKLRQKNVTDGCHRHGCLEPGAISFAVLNCLKHSALLRY